MANEKAGTCGEAGNTAASGASAADRIVGAALQAADLALGAADYALEAARKLTTQLAGQGARRRDEITHRLNLLAERGRRLRLSTRAHLDQLGTRLATRADLERLEARISALEKAARGES